MRQILVYGQVQGVGFRPLVYQIATALGAHGFVRNVGGAVEIVLEKSLESAFLSKLHAKLPPQAQILEIHTQDIAINALDFSIQPSLSAPHTPDPLPLDKATCMACLQDLHDPTSRFYGYAFTTCAQCGPRFSMLYDLPFDRDNTSMRAFEMCNACARDYHDPQSRRFFAQGLSCPQCAIALSFHTQEGVNTSAPLQACIEVLQKGGVVAIKGIGGFALMGDAYNTQTTKRIREIKTRPFKPLSVMVAHLAMARDLVYLNPLEEQTLQESSAPILIARAKAPLNPLIAPHLDTLGLCLPYTPLHHLILQALDRPLIFTSANYKGVGIFHTLEQVRALEVEGILDHDRAIVHPIEDSVVRVSGGRVGVVRLGRALAPLSVPSSNSELLCGFGAQSKASLCFSQYFSLVSPEMGSLESVQSVEHYQDTLNFYHHLRGTPEHVGIDLHPGYVSSKLGQEKAQEWGISLSQVQHHEAHFYALLGEYARAHPLEPGQRVLGWIADGFGLGLQGQLWGAEVFEACYQGFWEVKRLYSLEPFEILTTPKALRDSSYCAYALARAHHLQGLLDRLQIENRDILDRMLDCHLQTHATTSLGRLFDAIACFCGVGGLNSYEAQSAAQLESLARSINTSARYALELDQEHISYRALLTELQADLLKGQEALSARKFHNALAHLALELHTRQRAPLLVGGGVFVNSLLCEGISRLLGDRVFFPQMLPFGDGAIAFGQVEYLKNQRRQACGMSV
ncbi:carbamoyltransferase HypF [Helicobacter baculiformis]|uniref:acylphosphatase n=1 Tax=Helicobacter baculiformis TaxID=427351 RepID=A0ABV7ZFI8_9HELI|nr:carbamoyltransferase HypF [Helicobacter baculiformis]